MTFELPHPCFIRYHPRMSADTRGSNIVHSVLGNQADVHADDARARDGETVCEGLGEGAKNFDIRYIKLQSRASSPIYARPGNRANYVLNGRGQVELDTKPHAIGPHDFVYAPPNVRHRITNEGNSEMILLCIRGASS